MRQKGPGACPKCGMALEPVTVARGHEDRVDVPGVPRSFETLRACPICGMALEPRVVTIEENNPELDDMTRRFWWSAAITVPMLAFMISGSCPDGHCRRYCPTGG